MWRIRGTGKAGSQLRGFAPPQSRWEVMVIGLRLLGLGEGQLVIVWVCLVSRACRFFLVRHQGSWLLATGDTLLLKWGKPWEEQVLRENRIRISDSSLLDTWMKSRADSCMSLEYRRELGLQTIIYEVPSVQVSFKIETGYNYIGPKYWWIRGGVKNKSWGTPSSRSWKKWGEMYKTLFIDLSRLIYWCTLFSRYICFVMGLVDVSELFLLASVFSASSLIIKMSYP